MTEKSRADLAMEHFLAQDRQRSPKAEPVAADETAPKTPVPAAPAEPRVIERTVYVGPDFWTIVGAIIVAQFATAIVALLLFYAGFTLP